MKRNIIDNYDMNHHFKKRLRKINDMNTLPADILLSVQNKITEDFVGRKIETQMGFRSLTIYSEKKKNAALGIIKDSIEDIILSYMDSGDMDLLFSIYKLDNRVIIESKRIIEQ